MKNHLVRGIVRSADLADDLVGPSAALTKLRTNIYDAEDTEWKEVKVFVNFPLIIFNSVLCQGLDSEWS